MANFHVFSNNNIFFEKNEIYVTELIHMNQFWSFSLIIINSWLIRLFVSLYTYQSKIPYRIVLIIKQYIWVGMFQTLYNKMKAPLDFWAQTASGWHLFVDLYEIRNFTFLHGLDLTFVLYFELLKIASHDAMDIVIKFLGQSWPGNICRITYLWLQDSRDLL